MELAVPGTYIAGEPLVTIAAFAPQLQVISSKQRPRKLTIHGGDGAEYMFLLKGHEVSWFLLEGGEGHGVRKQLGRETLGRCVGM